MSNVINAIKKIYPGVQGGFVYWETKPDGSPWENPEDGLRWENTEYKQPAWSEIASKLDSLDLQEIRDIYYTELVKLREAEQYAPYTYNAIVLKATESSQNKLANVSDIFNGLSEITWLDINKNPITFTKNDIHNIKIGLYNRAFALYVKEGTIIAEINAITDLNTLEAYNVQERWEAS